jgi:2-methylcitrate dehydratase PrpD
MTASPSAMQAPLAVRLATWIASVKSEELTDTTIAMSKRLVMDVLGLCIAAREADYVAAVLASTEFGGPCTAFGHAGSFSAYDAALINGTAAHGEDFDDTFEGGPVHSGAVIVPAMVALCEREHLGGDALLRGIAVGSELMCRLSLATPRAIHKAGFHPTAVIGALAAAAGAASALELDVTATASAIGIAGSMASGIIEYLAEGTSTKRMHAGWAAQSGIRAALMARAGFDGPPTVLDGTNGFYKAFAPSLKPDFDPVLADLGRVWVMDTIAFKPYACGTMTQPYIDCAIKLAESGVDHERIEHIECDVGEGTVHRLWEELAVKQKPPTPYAAKFSTPFCMAIGFFDRRAGFNQFTEARITDPAVLALAGKISYRIDPDNPYPKNFTGHLRATMVDGNVVEFHQPHMRGGAHEPLSDAEVEQKFADNALYGGWSGASTQEALDWMEHVFNDDRISAAHLRADAASVSVTTTA